MNRVTALFILLVLPFGLRIVSAQEFRSTLTGTVADQSGAMVGRASVSAINPETQQSFRSETTSAGTYFIPFISPSTYTVNVTASGFRT
jgi:Carboxypeptidase regulatory-like domain